MPDEIASDPALWVSTPGRVNLLGQSAVMSATVTSPRNLALEGAR